MISFENPVKSLDLPLLKTSFADKKEDMNMRLDKIYEEFSRILVSKKSRYVRAARLSDLYNRAGGAAHALDNMLYGELGMSCEEIVKVVRQGNVSV